MSPLVLVLNNDTELHPDCLRNLYETSVREDYYSFFAPKIVEAQDATRLYAAGLMFSDRGYGNRSQRFSLSEVRNPMEVFGVCGAAALFRRDCLQKVGLFNEDYFFLNEDLELSIRHQLLGYKCLYVPNAVVSHLGSSTLKNFESLAVEEAVKNSLCTLLTVTPTSVVKQHSCRILGFYLQLWFTLIISGYFRETVIGLFRVFLRTRKLLRTRSIRFENASFDPDHIESLLYRGTIYVNLPKGTVEFK